METTSLKRPAEDSVGEGKHEDKKSKLDAVLPNDVLTGIADTPTQTPQSSTTSDDQKVTSLVKVTDDKAEESAKSANEDSTKVEEVATQGNKKQQQKEQPNPKAKRKVLVVFGYCGEGYQGSQKQKNEAGSKTIEDELERAIGRAGGIAKENQGDLRKIQWGRAARTDKGVHAIGNVVNLNMILDPPGIQERINSFLPPQIRVFAISRALGAFNCRTFAESRVYEYLLPTQAFIPILHNSTPLEQATEFFKKENMRERVNELLSAYEGTHNFWNYTLGKKYTDSSSSRFMTSVKCSEPFEFDGMPLVRISVHGQSFMLHQIRKMIGMVILAVRHTMNTNVIFNTYGPVTMSIPMAPGEFLMLDRIYYEGYNRKLRKVGSDFPEINIDALPGRQEFKEKFIYPLMVEKEKKELIVKKFMHKIDHWKPFEDGKELDFYQWMKKHSVRIDYTGVKPTGAPGGGGGKPPSKEEAAAAAEDD